MVEVCIEAYYRAKRQKSYRENIEEVNTHVITHVYWSLEGEAQNRNKEDIDIQRHREERQMRCLEGTRGERGSIE